MAQKSSISTESADTLDSNFSPEPSRNSKISMFMLVLSLIGIGVLIVLGYFLFIYVKMLTSPKLVPPLPPTPTPYNGVFFPPTSPPELDDTEAQGKFCGGIAAIQCPSGYYCQLDGNYPDAGGSCQKSL